MTRPSSAIVALSLKMYFGHERTMAYVESLLPYLETRPLVREGRLRAALLPTFLSLPELGRRVDGTPLLLGAQDLCQADEGPFTGEVSGSELARLGVRIAEIGHAERRALYGETDELVTAKVAAASRNGLIPLLCIGEPERTDPAAVAEMCAAHVRSAMGDAHPAELWVAYEPHWAIGASEPAPVTYVRAVCERLRHHLDRLAVPSSILYGGSAGPGLLTQLAGAVDGVFLGRFGHDPAAFDTVLGEAEALLQAPSEGNSPA